MKDRVYCAVIYYPGIIKRISMNIFVLNKDPVIAAQDQCDKHVVKMVLETAQILCTAFPKGEAPYRQTHFNHPCCIWARATIENYNWLLLHGKALAAEYTYRYDKRHKSEAVIDWCKENLPNLPKLPLTSFALAMPDEYRVDDPVQSYRNYYKGDKSSIAQWNKTRLSPEWF